MQVERESTGCSLASTDDVEARGNDVAGPPALYEVVLHREHEQPLSRVHVMRLQLQRRRHRSDLSSSFHGDENRLYEDFAFESNTILDGCFPSFSAISSWSAPPVWASSCRGNELTLDGRRAVLGFAPGELAHNCAFFNNLRILAMLMLE
jgi:hypothetical protein